MKLTTKFTLWYFGIMLVVLLIGGAIVYYEIQWKLSRVEVVRHQRLNDLIAQQIRQGGDYTGHPTRKRATVTVIPADSVPKGGASYYTRGVDWNPEFQTREFKLVVTSFYTINGQHYRVITYSFIPSFYQLLPGVVDSFKWILLVLLVLVIISGGLISKYILAPFKRTMRVIGSFDLKQKEALRLPGTQTSEFRELNQFLRKMTDKAREDYQSLKEFTENASHELQTPTAIIRGKLDLLMESDIRDEQAILIAEMQNALERLSRIHSSLTLLTKLENQEYAAEEPVCISNLARETLAAFGELIDLKSLVLQAHIEKGIYVQLHASLADLLLTNLISNAIRHNVAPAGGKGFIGVHLTKEGLVIVNSGREPQVPTEELFERFKKGNAGSDSIGIGLAIVRQICELSHFDIAYRYDDGMHKLAVAFRPNSPASKLLQNLSFALRLS
ncbi:MAG TPA: HAMP domain-containing sensor histidine kinase [Puia sp.]|jgi:two-component system OmpR family sensor kinase|nr:HAMP domain-containing sensor histidine kinase [Puia sp.]